MKVLSIKECNERSHIYLERIWRALEAYRHSAHLDQEPVVEIAPLREPKIIVVSRDVEHTMLRSWGTQRNPYANPRMSYDATSGCLRAYGVRIAVLGADKGESIEVYG